MVEQSKISDWKVRSKYGITNISNGEMTFNLLISNPSNLLSFSAKEVVETLERVGKSGQTSLVLESSQVLKVWSDSDDTDMDYFNDFLFLLESIESVFGGFAWNWAARELF